MTVGKNLLYGPLHRIVYDVASPEQVAGVGGGEKRENE